MHVRRLMAGPVTYSPFIRQTTRHFCPFFNVAIALPRFVYPRAADIESPERFSSSHIFSARCARVRYRSLSVRCTPRPYPALRRSRSSPPRQSVRPLRSDTAALNCAATLMVAERDAPHRNRKARLPSPNRIVALATVRICG